MLVIVAGGIGLLRAASRADEVLHRRRDYGEVALLYGARTPADLVFRAELDRWGAR